MSLSDKVWLSNGCPESVPGLPPGVYLPWGLNDDGNGQVDVVRVHQPHSDAGIAAKRCMHCIMRQNLAVDPIIACGGNRPADHQLESKTKAER